MGLHARAHVRHAVQEVLRADYIKVGQGALEEPEGCGGSCGGSMRSSACATAVEQVPARRPHQGAASGTGLQGFWSLVKA